jgi:hypothetical protein
MLRVLTFAVSTIAFLTLATTAQAQRYGRRGEYEPRSVSALIDRVHTDLNHAYEGRHFSSGDRKRLDKAEENLRDFAKKWERGRFDKGELDEAIGSIQHVLDNNHLDRGERQALDDDVAQLRAMREAYDRHEIG